MRGLDPVMVRFNKGCHEIGNGCGAWIEPDGSWGWSNAGLITSGECPLLVDTLYDPHMTRSMLSAMRDASAAARQIDMHVNTPADVDHTYGNRVAGCAPTIPAAPTDGGVLKVPTTQTVRTILEETS